jgi:hypothetical protein
MTQTKYTPGPWRIYDLLSNHEIITDRKTAPETESIGLFSKNPSPANAHLIAAAPELLEALELLFIDNKNGCVADDWRMEKAKATIDKAKGLAQ